MKPAAYAYARFSTKGQDKGTSLDRQYEAAAQMCERMGWDKVETLTDKGRSAWKGDHLRVGELGKFKARVDQGDIAPGSFLVIENLDRLSRQDVKRARRWIEEVTDAGIGVAVCHPSPGKVFDEASLSGENIIDLLQYLLEAQRSNKESERKSELQHGAISRFMDKARKGIVYSKRAPMWLRGVKDGKFEVIEERAALVRQIYEWSADGLGRESICRKLNGAVEPWTEGWKATKPSWKLGYIRDILTTPAVEGEYHIKTGPDRKPTGEVIRDYYPRIVPPELVECARAALLSRRKTGGPNHSEARNLFAGRLRCGHCGDTMLRTVQGSKGKQYEYLRCTRYQNGSGCANTTLYRYDKFERAALKEILHLALDSSYFTVADETGPLIAKLAQLNKDVEGVEAEQKRLLRFVMQNDEATEAEDLLNEMRPRLAALKRERDAAKEALDRARGSVSPDEHLSRVAEVHESIYSEDQTIRDQARRRVRDAIQSVVHAVECRRTLPDAAVKPIRRTPERQIIMTLGAGKMAFLFNNEGECVQRIDLANRLDLQRGFEGDVLGQLKPVTEAIERRMNREAPQRQPIDPSQQRWKLKA